MRCSAASPARFSGGSRHAASRSATGSSSPPAASSGRSTTPSTARSRSSASSSSSSPRGRPGRSSSRAKERSQRCARRSARQIPRTPRRGRSEAISPPRCPTTSCTAPTPPSRRSARSPSGSVTDPTVAAWTRENERYTDARAEQAWAANEITWGIWNVPESELHALPDLAGKEIVELGCGTAYFGAWLKKAGAARVVGVDPTPAQLETARRCEERFGLGLEFVEAFGEDVPLPDASFDLAVSEYGASIWGDPYRWIPEAARLLRPGGELVFLRNSTVSLLCMDIDGVTENLQRPQRGLNRIEWPDTGEVEFHLPHGELMNVLRESGFAVEQLIELYAPEGSETHAYYDYMTP